MKNNLEQLIYRNSLDLSGIFDISFVESAKNNELTATDALEANDELAISLYGSEIASLVKGRKLSKLDNLHGEMIEDISVPEYILGGIDLNRLGAVVVRPESLHLTSQITNLLNYHGLDVIYEKTTEIDFLQYWAMYNKGLTDWESKNDFPSRTFNYINREIKLLIVSTKKEDILNSGSLSEYLFEKIKGKQGVYTQNTLRGHIAYVALHQFIKNDEKNFKEDTGIALDPIGMYRKLVNNTIKSDRSHLKAESPLLFYAGQAVHIPNANEINRDLRVICSVEDFINLKNIGDNYEA